MNLSQRKVILLAVAGVVTFGFIAALMLQFLPGPRKDSDYLVAGAVATAAALGVIFAGIMSDPVARESLFGPKGKR